MASILCFFLSATNRQRLSLRRYVSRMRGATPGACPQMPGEYSYHDAMTPYDEAPIALSESGYIESVSHLMPARDFPGWPAACGCGYVFDPEDEWQLFNERLYIRSDTGTETTIRDAGSGALWYADWLLGGHCGAGPDGHILMCRTPGGDWCIDQRASNCTARDDNEHRCWIRHGDPTDPQGAQTGQKLHVDKNGRTCSAGAGSIVFDDYHGYHGFLHNGALVQC